MSLLRWPAKEGQPWTRMLILTGGAHACLNVCLRANDFRIHRTMGDELFYCSDGDKRWIEGRSELYN